MLWRQAIARSIAERRVKRQEARATGAAEKRAAHAEWCRQDRIDEALELNWINLSSRAIRCNE